MENTVRNIEMNVDFLEVQKNLESLIAARRALVLATHDAQGECELGVAPFVHVNGAFAVLLSGLAAHTRQLERLPQAQIMLLEDEAEARQPYARMRMTLECSVERFGREHERSDVIFALMQARFGSIVPLLRGLNDFHAFVFTPKQGRFIAGFGKAYRLDGLDVVEHLRG